MARTNKSARRSAADKAKGIDQTDSSLHKPLITGVKRKNKMRAVVLRDLAQNVRSDPSGLKLDTDDVVLVNLSAQS
ncbi:hypothetical protein ACHWQZ_G001419 [Mnemiopsis leidyi]|jgi:ribosomal protein L14